MTQLYDIGRSALASYQAALTAVSRNVANINTPGYARQSVAFGQMPDGAGVDVLELTRNVDHYAQQAARGATADRASSEVRSAALERLDTLFSDEATGLAEPLRRLQQSLSALSANPTDVAARQAVLSEAGSFAARVQSLSAGVADEAAQATRSLASTVRSAQDSLDELARVQSHLDKAGTVDAATASLMDKRDVLLGELSESLGAKAQIRSDGQLELTLANGQPLLRAGVALRLSVGSDSFNQPQLMLDGVAQPARVLGGAVGGQLSLLSKDLPEAGDALGRIASGIATLFNDAQAAGVDLDGNAGQALFDAPAPRLTAAADNAGSANLSVSLDQSAELLTGRIQLRWDGANWNAQDAAGASLSLSGSGTPADPLRVAGLALSVGGTPAVGDQFQVEPPVAGQLRLRSLSAEDLATAPAGAAANSGDNSNLINLQQGLAGGYFDGGRTSVAEAVNQWVSRTGQSASSALSATDVARAAEDFAIARRESVQGVNLDEEAADLMRFEQAYQAAAQVMATANSLFESVLAAVRR